MFRVYYNPHCSKCRQCVRLLEELGQEFEVVDYQATPPSRAELEQLWELLGPEMLREGVPAEGAVEAVLARPLLLQRPIVWAGDRAVVARPPERVRELIKT